MLNNNELVKEITDQKATGNYDCKGIFNPKYVGTYISYGEQNIKEKKTSLERLKVFICYLDFISSLLIDEI